VINTEDEYYNLEDEAKVIGALMTKSEEKLSEEIDVQGMLAKRDRRLEVERQYQAFQRQE
jgi:hypothetical protein